MIDDIDLHRCCDRDILRLSQENEELKARIEALAAPAPRADGAWRMTTAQRDALWALCGGYNVMFREDDYRRAFDLPENWVQGWIGGPRHGYGGDGKLTVYVGCSPEGQVHS